MFCRASGKTRSACFRTHAVSCLAASSGSKKIFFIVFNIWFTIFTTMSPLGTDFGLYALKSVTLQHELESLWFRVYGLWKAGTDTRPAIQTTDEPHQQLIFRYAQDRVVWYTPSHKPHLSGYELPSSNRKQSPRNGVLQDLVWINLKFLTKRLSLYITNLLCTALFRASTIVELLKN